MKISAKRLSGERVISGGKRHKKIKPLLAGKGNLKMIEEQEREKNDRNFIAMEAMLKMVAFNTTDVAEEIAKRGYIFADAFLKERKKQNEERA